MDYKIISMHSNSAIKASLRDLTYQQELPAYKQNFKSVCIPINTLIMAKIVHLKSMVSPHLKMSWKGFRIINTEKFCCCLEVAYKTREYGKHIISDMDGHKKCSYSWRCLHNKIL